MAELENLMPRVRNQSQCGKGRDRRESAYYHAGERLRLCAQLPIAEEKPAHDPIEQIHARWGLQREDLTQCLPLPSPWPHRGAERVLDKQDESVIEVSEVPAMLGPFLDGISPPPGLPPPCGLPSHGSLLHDAGRCKPCMWFWKPKGCENGQDCGHCHLCPYNETTIRKRRKRAQARRAEFGRDISQGPWAHQLLKSQFSQDNVVPHPSQSSPDYDVLTQCDSDLESLSSFGIHSTKSRNHSPVSPRSPRMGTAWQSASPPSRNRPPGLFFHDH